MAIGLVGRKCGMTRVFTDAGESVPVTVIEALRCCKSYYWTARSGQQTLSNLVSRS